MPDHILRYVDRHVPTAIVNLERVPDHLREDGRVPRPRLQHDLAAGLIQQLHFAEQLHVDVGPFLQRSTHARPLLAAAPADDELVGVLATSRAITHRRLAPWRLRLSAPGRLALTTTVWVISRVHGGAAYGGPNAHPARAPGLADLHCRVLGVS